MAEDIGAGDMEMSAHGGIVMKLSEILLEDVSIQHRLTKTDSSVAFVAESIYQPQNPINRTEIFARTADEQEVAARLGRADMP